MNWIPLLLCYVGFPLSRIVFRSLDSEFVRNWIDGAWALAFAAALVTVSSGARATRRLLTLIAMVSPLITFAAMKLAFSYTLAAPETAIVLMEVKPFLYAAGVAAWICAWGYPSSGQITTSGLCLAIFIALQTIVDSTLAGAVVRPVGSGEVNYDAALLVFAFIVAITQPQFSLYTALALAVGVTLTMSRTNVICLLAIVVLSRRLPKIHKAALLAAAMLIAMLAPMARQVSLSAESVDRYFMWTSGIDLLTRSAESTLLGYTVGAPLPATVDRALFDLWSAQTGSLGLAGVYPFNYHAFILRFTLTWGTAATVFISVAGAAWVARQRSEEKALLFVAMAMQSLTMGLFYLSNVAFVALWLLVRPGERMQNGAPFAPRPLRAVPPSSKRSAFPVLS